MKEQLSTTIHRKCKSDWGGFYTNWITGGYGQIQSQQIRRATEKVLDFWHDSFLFSDRKRLSEAGFEHTQTTRKLTI